MANSKLKQTQAIIISICIGLFFVYSAYQCLQAYAVYEMESTRLHIASDQINQAKQQRKRVEQYNKGMATFANFTGQVKLFGLMPENWQSYDVSVNKSLTFADAGNILDQLSHDKTYYFLPVHLFIGTGAYRQDPTITTDETGNAPPVPPAIENNNEAETGEVSFSVHGKFMVRDRL